MEEEKAVAEVPAAAADESSGNGHTEQSKREQQQQQKAAEKKEGKDAGEDEDGQAGEEEEEEEATPLLEASPVVTGKRQRKKAKTLLEELSKEAMQKPAKKEVQEHGSGEPLGSNPIVEDFLSKRKAEQLTELHRFLYGKPGTRTTRKKQIREFRGFPESMSETTRERRREGLGRKPIKVLKDMCHGLDIPLSGTKKEEILDSVMEWVSNPTPSGASVRGKKKAKKKSATPNKKKKATTPKKRAESGGDKGAAAAAAQPLSAFQLFLKDAKPQYQREHPEASILEMTKGLRKQWQDMSDEEKQLYEDAAAIERRNAEEAGAVAKRKAPASPAKRKRKAKPAASGKKSKKSKAVAKTKRASTSTGKRKAISMDMVVSDDSDMEEADQEQKEEEEGDDEGQEGDGEDGEEKRGEQPEAQEKEEEEEREEEEEEERDGEPEAKKAKSAGPDEEELRNAVFSTLRGSDLSKMTKKKVKAAMASQYPGVDLSDKAHVIVSAINDYVHEQSS